jgi:hypothetical protein
LTLLHRRRCWPLLVTTACSGNVRAIDTHHATTSTTAGSNGSNGSTGIIGAGGDTTSTTTGEGGPSATSGTSTTSSTIGTGGQGGRDPVEAGFDAAEDRGSLGGAGAQDAALPPAIDYSIWELQLPIGSGNSPTTVPPSQLASFTDIYFYRAPDGGQIFMDPATGVTTADSNHCRTELRESTPSGAAASWSPSGTNTMTVNGKVLKGSNVTIAQVFNRRDGITLAELQYSSSGFTVFYEESRGNGGTSGLGNATPLNTPYTFTMSLSKNVLTHCHQR